MATIFGFSICRNADRHILKIAGLPLLLALAASGCATTKAPEQEANPDPFEKANRKVYGFNTAVDKHVVKPISDTYVSVTPKAVQTGVSNFFTNLSNINVILNDLLQAKFKQGFADTARFAVNTTAGVLGLFDVATRLGLEQHDEDFGQTLGVWGVAPGPYLVLPLLGPATLRETPSFVVDTATNPAGILYPPLLAVQAVDTRARAEGALKFIDEAALDPYVFTREAYLQWRAYLVHDGEPPQQELSELEEDFDAFEKEAGTEAEDTPGATDDDDSPASGPDEAGERKAAPARANGGVEDCAKRLPQADKRGAKADEKKRADCPSKDAVSGETDPAAESIETTAPEKANPMPENPHNPHRQQIPVQIPGN